MGWLGDLFQGGAKGVGEAAQSTLEGVGTASRDIRTALTGKLDPEVAAELEGKFAEIDKAIALGQAEINKAEAQHTSVFVAGARPALLWVFVLAFFYNFVLRPIFVGFDIGDMPAIDATALWPLMGGMLGLGGMRTYEKQKGVQDKH